jgi:hypothetical protein
MDFIESFTVKLPDFSESEVDFSESFEPNKGLIIELAAIHEGLTSNYNFYSKEELEKALESWVSPYPKPIILNHDMNSEPIGRIMAAKMDTEEDGSSFVRLQVAITDPVAIQKVLDKRYLTGSVGGRAGKAICSISGEDLAKESANGRPPMPKYARGKVYKGKLAYLNMEDISFKEYSFVNQPADQKSGIRSIKPSGDEPIADSDSWIAKSSAFILHMDKEEVFSVQENESVLVGMKKRESRPIYLQLKGAFLSALAVQESENIRNVDESLLYDDSSENKESQENHNMEKLDQEEDILAVANGLSEDLSNIAASVSVKEADETEDPEGEEPEESQVENNVLNDESDQADVQSDTADSEKAEESQESSESPEEDEDEVQEQEVQDSELTTSEEVDEPSEELLQLRNHVAALENQNARLKEALHKTLAERVVDTKIGLGLESAGERESLISEHMTRTASSLADSLRDMAKLPARKAGSVVMPEVASEAEVTESEDNVVTIDSVDQKSVQANPDEMLEQILVDALMGRRKL